MTEKKKEKNTTTNWILKSQKLILKQNNKRLQTKWAREDDNKFIESKSFAVCCS